MSEATIIDYQYRDDSAAHTHAYLWKPVEDLIYDLPHSKVFDLGCGNGSFARQLNSKGLNVEGVDPSTEGIKWANQANPKIRLEVGNAYENLTERFGSFPIVTSLEVVEHVYYPRQYARCIAELLEPGGYGIVSTPYHGYIKNLVLALSGRMDNHFTALWDHGHIKFWSVDTLTQLFTEVGLRREKVIRVGRIPVLAKSMILVFRKP